MTKYSIVGALVAIGLAVSLTSAVADGPGAGYAVVKVGTVSFIDRALNLFQLEDGTELRVSDPRMLQDLSEGELVKVDFTTSGSWNVVNSIEPAEPEATLGAAPTAIDGVQEH